MLLAARALGLGATLTTLYLLFEKEAEAALGLPDDTHSYAILPIGYPVGQLRPGRPHGAGGRGLRRPLGGTLVRQLKQTGTQYCPNCRFEAAT